MIGFRLAARWRVVPDDMTNQLTSLPRMVLDRLAAIPLDHLLGMITGMKTVHVEVEMPEDDLDAVEGASNSGLILKILQGELARRRQ
jgi:hypothetical protein